MTNILDTLVFPLIYTVIGAIIGGWFAYKIAKSSFMLDRISQGNECIDLLKIRIDHINDKIEDLRSHLQTLSACENDRSSSTFLDNLFTKTTLLETDISSFLSYWEYHGDTVSLCRTKRISRDQRKREQYKAFEEAITRVLPEIAHYQMLVKKYSKMHHEKTKPESTIQSMYDFLHSDDSRRILTDANSILGTLKEKCSDIQNSYAALNP